MFVLTPSLHSDISAVDDFWKHCGKWRHNANEQSFFSLTRERELLSWPLRRPVNVFCSAQLFFLFSPYQSSVCAVRGALVLLSFSFIKRVWWKGKWHTLGILNQVISLSLAIKGKTIVSHTKTWLWDQSKYRLACACTIWSGSTLFPI